MKKLLLIVALLTISLTLCFSQAAVSGWGRGLFVPVAVADDDMQSLLQVSWDAKPPRIGFTISGSSDNIGAQVDVNYDGYAVKAGDNQKIWVKPMEMLTITIGAFFDETLRGNAGFVANNWVRPAGIIGDDVVFYRVGRDAGTNAEIAIAPVDGLYVYAAFGSVAPSWWNNDWGRWGGETNIWMPGETSDRTDTMALMFEEGQYGAGYDIPGIGVLRAQFLGKVTTIEEPWGVINAAFKLTMVEGLMVDLGAFIPTDTDQAEELATIGLYGNYVMDTLTLHLAGKLTLFEEDENVDGSGDPAFHVGLGVEYGLESGPTIQADLRYANDKFSGMEDGQIDIGLFAKWSYSNGLWGIGAQMSTNNFTTGVVKDDPTAMAIIIPIRLEYWL